MSRQFWNETLFWSTVSGTAIATQTETILFPNVTIPANFMQDGRALRLRVLGQYSNAASAQALTFRVRWGGVSGTLIMQSAAITTLATAVTNAGWDLNLLLQTRSNGSTGTLMGMGCASLFAGAAVAVGATTGASGDSFMAVGTNGANPAAVTLDLTADTALSVTAQWSGTSSASNTIQGLSYVLESMN